MINPSNYPRLTSSYSRNFFAEWFSLCLCFKCNFRDLFATWALIKLSLLKVTQPFYCSKSLFDLQTHSCLQKLNCIMLINISVNCQLSHVTLRCAVPLLHWALSASPASVLGVRRLAFRCTLASSKRSWILHRRPHTTWSRILPACWAYTVGKDTGLGRRRGDENED